MRGGGYYVFIMFRFPDVCPDVLMSRANIGIFSLRTNTDEIFDEI